MSLTYSERLGELTPAQFQRALDAFDLGQFLDAAPAPGGLFGQNVFVNASSGAWVLRGAPHYDGQFEKERFFSHLIHDETDADAPSPFLIEPSPSIFGWSFALMPRLPGENPGVEPTHPPRGHDERIALANALGAYLARIHSRSWPSCGMYDHATDALVPFDEPYADWLILQIREWTHRCRSRSWELGAPIDPTTERATTPADLEWIDAVIEDARSALSQPFEPVLVHTDYKDNNTVGQREDGAWRINGVFDVGEMYVGNGEYDLARTACAYNAFSADVVRTFVQSYHDARSQSLATGFAERMRAYILLDRLIIWEYGQRNSIWFPEGLTLRKWAEPFVNIANAI